MKRKPPERAAATEYVPLRSRRGRLVVLATVLGSGTVFLEMTVVNVALPAIARDLDLGIAGLQWILDGFLLTLSALILLGGALGDVHGRGRIFRYGLVAFAAACVCAAVAPNLELLVAARLLQGAAGALLVPNSLAILETVFAPAERGRAIGQWAGWSGASTALGPLLGGWLIDATSWRWIFAAVAPFALLAVWLAARSLPPMQQAQPGRRVDYAGAAFVTLGLSGVITFFIAGAVHGFANAGVLAAGSAGTVLLAVFIAFEARARAPLLPLRMFRSRTFTGANLTTLFVYAALSGLFFLLMLQLQNALGFSALRAGAALLPINLLMVTLSPMAGQLAGRFGARWLLTAGSFIAGVGMLLFTRVRPGTDYLPVILPALVVFGLGLATLVAPLTTTVLASAPAAQKGVASAFNNAVARLAALIATAVLPLAAGMGGLETLAGPALVDGYARAMRIAAALCFIGGVVAFATVRREPAREPRAAARA